MSYSKEQFIEDFKNAYNQSQQLHFIYRYVENGGKNISSIKFETVDREANIDITIVVTLSDGTTLRGNTIRVANSTLSGFVQTLEENVGALSNSVDDLNKSITHLNKFKFVNPLDIPECVYINEGDNTFDTSNLRLPYNYNNDVSNAREIGDVIMRAINQGFIRVTSTTADWILLPLLTAFSIDGTLYACFGGKDLNDYGGYSYYISLDYGANEVVANGHQL